jgi:aspartate carbamoyltransferase catalytic subunit
MLDHCLDIASLNQVQIQKILTTAQSYLLTDGGFCRTNTLKDTTLATLFFEPSTRTRCSFELAASYLGAKTLHLDQATSAAQKGETLLDTINNLAAMGVSLFAIRHPEAGLPQAIAAQAPQDVHIINAGDGCHAHPTQALGDMLTLQQYCQNFSQLRVAIIGDIAHSRVARSHIQALSTLGAGDIRLIAPPALMPDNLESLPVTPYHDLVTGLNDVNVIITLRIQKERLQAHEHLSVDDFIKDCGLTENKLAQCNTADNLIILHPGPVNRGVELSPGLADHPQYSQILRQVRNGVAVRMAVLGMLRGVNPDTR